MSLFINWTSVTYLKMYLTFIWHQRTVWGHPKTTKSIFLGIFAPPPHPSWRLKIRYIYKIRLIIWNGQLANPHTINWTRGLCTWLLYCRHADELVHYFFLVIFLRKYIDLTKSILILHALGIITTSLQIFRCH